MLVSYRAPRHHGIDALTGLVQTHIFYLIVWIKREDCQQQNNRKTKLTKLGGYFPHPHVYSNINLKNCQGEN